MKQVCRNKGGEVGSKVSLWSPAKKIRYKRQSTFEDYSGFKVCLGIVRVYPPPHDQWAQSLSSYLGYLGTSEPGAFVLALQHTPGDFQSDTQYSGSELSISPVDLLPDESISRSLQKLGHLLRLIFTSRPPLFFFDGRSVVRGSERFKLVSH